MIRYYNHNGDFKLESGDVATRLTIAYHTYGTLNADASNVVWVCHAFTASSDVADWWKGAVEEGSLLDPTKYFIVCANCLGSCYGTEIYDASVEIPFLTMRDLGQVHSLLADHLGLKKIHKLIGGSTGGMQAMEWAYAEPWRFDHLYLLATVPYTSAWVQASSEAQRMAISGAKEPQKGLEAARAISMLQFRGEDPYNLTQDDSTTDKLKDFKVCSYQRYQGEKFERRFKVSNYLSLLGSLDNHNIGRGRGGVAKALSDINVPTTVVSISSDIIFPPRDVRVLADNIPNAQYFEIDSVWGHDGFLLEMKQLTAIIHNK